MIPQIKQSDFIQMDGHYYMTSESLGDKLGFSDSRNGVQKIYQRHNDELAPFRTVVNLSTVKGKREVTAFDEQGCYIIAMLAKTEQAKMFRRALAFFLKTMRQQQLSFFDMQDEYNALRSKLASVKLENKLQQLEITHRQFNRLVELKGVLSMQELRALSGLGTNTLHTLYKLHRHSIGDFSSHIPLQFQLAAGGRDE